jgi:hypothetical protein
MRRTASTEELATASSVEMNPAIPHMQAPHRENPVHPIASVFSHEEMAANAVPRTTGVTSATASNLENKVTSE